MSIDHIRKENSIYVIEIPSTKTHIPRKFVLDEKYSYLIDEYISARPLHLTSNKFFMCYRKGRIINQPMGINKIGMLPQEIAEYLELPNPKTYTGHSFRRTSATLLADAGADMTTLKRHGGWKSSNVAEGYIEDSIQNKRKICNKILRSIGDDNNQEESDDESPSKRINTDVQQQTAVSVNVKNCSIQ